VEGNTPANDCKIHGHRPPGKCFTNALLEFFPFQFPPPSTLPRLKYISAPGPIIERGKDFPAVLCVLSAGRAEGKTTSLEFPSALWFSFTFASTPTVGNEDAHTASFAATLALV
jgi:hypothetical protein